MEVRKDWTYEDFPACEVLPEGAETLQGTGKEPGVAYVHDVVYAHTEVGDLRLQILIPFRGHNKPVLPIPPMRDKDGNFPAGLFDKNPQYPTLVYVQGSAWFPQNLYGDLPQLADLASRGFVVALVEYRDSMRAHFPAPILDAMNAVRFLRKAGRMYCVDPENIVMSGNSSGGHTALMAGFWCKEDKGDNLYPEFSAEVKGILALYPACDFTFPESNPTTPDHTKAGSPEAREMKAEGDMTPEEIDALTVRTYVTPELQAPPTLIIHGDKDRTVNAMCSVYLYEKMKECGKDVELCLLKGADHGGAEFWSPAAIDRMEAFLRKVFA